MINALDTLPEDLKDDEQIIAYLNFLDRHFQFYQSKILGLRTLYDPVRTSFPLELAHTMGAYLSIYDTDAVIIEKAANAAHLHKYVYNFDEVWKPIIDNIMQTDSRVYHGALCRLFFSPSTLMIPFELRTIFAKLWFVPTKIADSPSPSVSIVSSIVSES